MNNWTVVKLKELNIDIVYKTKDISKSYDQKFITTIKFPRNIKKLDKDFHKMIWYLIYNKLKDFGINFSIVVEETTKYLRESKNDYYTWMTNSHNFSQQQFVDYAIAQGNTVSIYGTYSASDILHQLKVLEFYRDQRNLTSIEKFKFNIKHKWKFKREKFTITIPITPINVIKIDKYGL